VYEQYIRGILMMMLLAIF